MSKSLPRLGKGLEALIPRTTFSSGKTLMNLPLNLIRPNAFQPRLEFDEEAILSLSKSIKAHGLVQPILVRRNGEAYELIAGERRFRASQLAGLESIPAVIRDMSDQDSLKTALIENLDRENLNPIEEAKGYQKLIDEFLLTHQEIAELFSRNRSTISNLLRLLQLPESLQKAIAKGDLSEGHARPLLGLKDKGSMVDFYNVIKSEGLTVRETEAKVAAKGDTTPKKTKGGHQLSLFKDFENQLSLKLKTKAQIVGTKKSGKIIIRYTSESQLHNLVSTLKMKA